MRIAVSGTHCSGKSTLIHSLLVDHTDYIHEPEAYEVLSELYGESFSAEPVATDFMRQLEFHVDRLQQYKSGDCVIFERTVVDYVAYILSLEDLQRRSTDNLKVITEAIELARNNVAYLDAIIFLPLRGFPGEAPIDEDLKLRRRVDARLEEIILNDELDLFVHGGPALVEAVGTNQERLAIVSRIFN